MTDIHDRRAPSGLSTDAATVVGGPEMTGVHHPTNHIRRVPVVDMHRRRYLLATATGFAALAGCAGNQSDDSENGTEGSGRSENTGGQSTETTRSGGQPGSQNGPTETTRNGGGRGTAATTVAEASLGLTSTAFDTGETIPQRFTCSGANVSPPLAIDGMPASTEALALVVDDPDAGAQPFTHWLLWNLPPDTTELPANVPQNGTVSALDSALQGTNDAGGIGYTGPCPPEGDGPHTYRFRLSALESPLGVEAGAERAAVDEAIDTVEIGRTLLRGTFERG